MPIENLHDHRSSFWALWKITEDEATLTQQVPIGELPSLRVTNPLKRLEFLAGRALLGSMLEKWNMPFTGLTKDLEGKPFFRDLPYQLSLSHSYPYVAAIIDKDKSVGIDLEQPKDKLLRIAERVLNSEELADANQDIVKHCIYWCSKETLIKVYGKRHLTLAKNLAIHPFQRENEGNLTGRIIAPDMVATIPLYYRVYDNFVVVHNV